MKKQIQKIFVLLLCVFFSSVVLAQETKYAGAPYPAGIPAQHSGIVSPLSAPQMAFNATTADTTYRTTVYTFNNITVFSYFDSTKIAVLVDTTVVATFNLNADTLANYFGSSGVYRIRGNKPYTVLIGDAITNYVNGYFALDQSGLGVSTKFNTWMMTSNSGYDPHFIVFAYQNGTQFTIRDLKTKQVLATSLLNAGEHYDFPNVPSISNTALQVSSNFGVSALAYTDQDYYVPSADGRFAGTLFYGFSGYSGSWANSITVTSYADSNKVLVTNSNTGDTLSSYYLNEGQVYMDTIRADIFWKVQSSKPVTTANIPYASWGGSYAYMARAADKTGRNVGTLFYVPTISSRLDVFSFDSSNTIKITRLGLRTEYPYPNQTVVDSAVVGEGGVRTITSTSFGNYVYKVEATKNVSVLQSNSGYGADFMPLNFALQLADLALSQADIAFSPPDSLLVVGNKLTITITAHNQGVLDASNVGVSLYAGDPDAGGVAPLIGSKVIPLIAAGGSQSVSFDYIVPDKPEYYNIVVKLDPDNTITESNESNNKASRFLKPNKDTKPPLSVSITAPNGLAIDSVTKIISPNPFTVQADIFNTGSISAANPRVVLTLFNGLTLVSGPADTTWASMPAAGSAKLVWKINANKDSSGLNFYSFKVTADSVPTKNVDRAINIPDIIPPAAPTGLSAVNATASGSIVLTWNSNTERDLAGYRIFYGPDTLLNGKGAKEGDSPIIVPKVATFTLTGLTGGPSYFAVQAGDFSGNLSPRSSVVLKTVLYVSKVSAIPKDFSLNQNYPNPFNPSTTIRFGLPMRSVVTLEIINTLGQHIATLINAEKDAGEYEAVWNAGVSSGIYFFRLRATAVDNPSTSFVDVKKMLLMK